MKSEALTPRMKAKFATYVPRVKSENEALPPSTNVFKAPVYRPANTTPARAGASDHLKYKTRGIEACPCS